MIVLLDTGPLGLITNANKNNPEAVQVKEWVKHLLRKHVLVCVAEIAYYESRRKHIHLKNKEGIERLDNFVSSSGIGYAPVTTEIIVKASELWGWARLTGQQTAHDEAIDADVILAATAIIMASAGEYVVIATTNDKHLARYTPAKIWKNIVI